MEYVFINFSELKLTSFAIIFGKHNLKKELSSNTFSIYSFSTDNYKIYIPVLSSTSKDSIGVSECKLFFKEFKKFTEYKPIAFLPEHIEIGNQIIKEFPEFTFIHLVFTGDSCKPGYPDFVKVVMNVSPDKNDMPTAYHFDFKLSIPFFFYKHQMSLVDFEVVDTIENKFSTDKVFVYGRRSSETKMEMRDRGYFLNKLISNISNDKVQLNNEMHEHIELQKISLGLYHLGNYFDYKKCMFNVIFETQYVDYLKPAGNLLTEKTTFALLFSNPFFLLANTFILNTIKELDIILFNDEFIGEDIEEKFLNFCLFINESTFEQRVELYKKYKKINIENRKKILEYINYPKYKVIDFIIS
jgi:hypothetical protein